MDYLPRNCMINFTKEQGVRMRTAIANRGLLQQVIFNDPTIQNNVSIDFLPSLSVCSNDAVDLTVVSNNPNYYFDWSNGEMDKLTTRVYPTTTNHQFRLKANSECISPKQIIVSIDFTVNDNIIVPPIFGAYSVCVSGTAEYTNTMANGVWASSNTNVATISSTGLVSGVAAGNTEISYTITTSPTGCSVVAKKTIYVVPPNATISIAASPSVICLGESTTLNIGNGGTLGIEYVWYDDLGHSGDLGVGLPITITPPNSGSVTFYYEATTPCSSNQIDGQISITVNPLPVMQPITGLPSEICGGNNYPINYGPTTGGTGDFLAISTNTPLVSLGSVNTTPSSPPYLPTFDPANAGAGTLTYTFTDNTTKCKNATAVNIVVLPQNPVITGITDLCPNNIYHFTANAMGGIWASANTNIATVDANGNITAIDGGTTTITYEVILCGVVKTASYTVNVQIIPKIIGQSFMCLNSTQTLTLNTTAPFTQVNGINNSWSSLDPSIADFPNPATGSFNSICDLQAKQAGTVTVRYSYSDQSKIKCIGGAGYLTMKIRVEDCTKQDCGTLADNCTNIIDQSNIYTLNIENNSFCIKNDVQIGAGKNIVIKNAVINIEKNKKIEVLSGGSLTILGSHLYSCDAMWQGITVAKGGKVYIDNWVTTTSQGSEDLVNNSLIEDADVAVAYDSYTDYVDFTGNYLLNIKNTIFNRNRISIQIANYKNNIANNLESLPFYISNCIFTSRSIPYNQTGLFWPTIDAIKQTPISIATVYPHTPLTYNTPYIDDANNNSTNYPDDNTPDAFLKNGTNSKPDAGIYVFNVGNINVNNIFSTTTFGKVGTALDPNTNIFDNMNIGIDVFQSNVIVNNSTFQKPNPSSQVYNTSALGINVNNTKENMIVVNTPNSQFGNNAFFNMNKAVMIGGSSLIKVNNCDIRSIQDIGIITDLGANGIVINNAYYDEIETNYNNIYNIRDGIWYSGGGSGRIETLFGKFNANKNNIGTILPNAAQENIPNGAYVDRAITLENFSSAAVTDDPVNCNENVITNAFNGIKLSNWRNKRTIVTGNNADLAPDYIINLNEPHYGIWLENGMPEKAGNNILQGNTVKGSDDNILTGNYDATKQTAILLNNQFKTTVQCNYVGKSQHGFRFVNANTGTKWWNNMMNSDNQNGMTLEDIGVIGSQGSLPGTKGGTCTSDNIWNGYSTGAWGGALTNCINNSNPLSSVLIVRQSGADMNPDGGGLNNDPALLPYQAANKSILYGYNLGNCQHCVGDDAMTGLGDLAIENLEAIANGSLPIATIDSAQRLYSMQQNLFEQLRANPNIETQSVTLSNFIQTNQWSNFDFIYYTNYFLARGDMGIVDLLLGFWPLSSNNVDNNYYTYYDWLATMYTVPNWQPSLTDVQTLANKCPATDGSVVYAARNLYNRLTKRINNFANNCSNNTYSRKVPTPIADNSELLIYPNPAKTQININYKGIKEVNVYDYTGRILINKIFDGVNTARLDVSTLKKGFYIVKLASKDGETKSTKLIIE